MIELAPLHPIILHFPVALLPMAALFDLLGRLTKRPTLAHTAFFTLLAAAVESPFSVLSGWLWLNEMGEMPHLEMRIHQWLGTAIPVLLIPFAPWRYRIHVRKEAPSANLPRASGCHARPGHASGAHRRPHDLWQRHARGSGGRQPSTGGVEHACCNVEGMSQQEQRRRSHQQLRDQSYPGQGRGLPRNRSGFEARRTRGCQRYRPEAVDAERPGRERSRVVRVHRRCNAPLRASTPQAVDAWDCGLNAFAELPDDHRPPASRHRFRDTPPDTGSPAPLQTPA